MDGRYHSCELHIVHYDTRYASPADALEFSDGITVLGVFIDSMPAECAPHSSLVPSAERLAATPSCTAHCVAPHIGNTMSHPQTLTLLCECPFASFS